MSTNETPLATHQRFCRVVGEKCSRAGHVAVMIDVFHEIHDRKVVTTEHMIEVVERADVHALYERHIAPGIDSLADWIEGA